MYPSASAVAADLPDAITLLGVGSLSKSGTDYGNTTNGVILESGVWARYVEGVRSTKTCLIDDDGNLTPGDDAVEDQFEPQYMLQGPPTYEFPSPDPIYPDPVPITRTSLCVWSGDSGGLSYDAIAYLDGYWGGVTGYQTQKCGAQKSPVGLYYYIQDEYGSIPPCTAYAFEVY